MPGTSGGERAMQVPENVFWVTSKKSRMAPSQGSAAGRERARGRYTLLKLRKAQ